jgi:hypothetical protein
MSDHPQRVSPVRHFAMRLAAWADDHRLTVISLFALMALFLGAVFAYLVGLGGAQHILHVTKLTWFRVFGGQQRIEKALNIYEELYTFGSTGYDRIDIKAISLYVTARNFEESLDRRLGESGLLRIIVLDPEVALASSETDTGQAFTKLAEAYGQKPNELRAEVLHSAVLLQQMKSRLGKRCEVKVFKNRSDRAPDPFWTASRSYQQSRSDDPSRRLDIIVPCPSAPTASDSPSWSGWRIRDRPRHRLVVGASEEFTTLWGHSGTSDLELVMKDVENRLEGYGKQ